LVAIGTFDPEIEIWDMDVLDVMFPVTILGEVKDGKKKKKKVQPDRHVDAVMDMSWNRLQRHVLASSSADTTVKLWDLNTSQAKLSIEHHSDKVQSVQWHPIEAPIMLTASFDRSICVLDSRSAQDRSTWHVDADPEVVLFHPIQPVQFLVSTESGIVQCFDVRYPNHQPIYTIHAHDGPVSAMDISPHVEGGCLVTGGLDQLIKVWDLNNNTPNMVIHRDMGVGKVFSLSFCPDSLLTLAAAGSEGRVQVWDVGSNALVKRAFAGRATFQEDKEEKQPIGLVDTKDDDSEDEHAMLQEFMGGGGEQDEASESE
jgi:periodic tryptophan protein 1